MDITGSRLSRQIEIVSSESELFDTVWSDRTLRQRYFTDVTERRGDLSLNRKTDIT